MSTIRCHAGLLMIILLISGCSRGRAPANATDVPAPVANVGLQFVPDEVRRAKDRQLHDLAMQLNPMRAMELRDSVIAPDFEFRDLHVVCGSRLALTPADAANGILERWCVVVTGIGREVGEAKWDDITQQVGVNREQTQGARESVWRAFTLEESQPCRCSN